MPYKKVQENLTVPGMPLTSYPKDKDTLHAQKRFPSTEISQIPHQNAPSESLDENPKYPTPLCSLVSTSSWKSVNFGDAYFSI